MKIKLWLLFRNEKIKNVSENSLFYNEIEIIWTKCESQITPIIVNGWNNHTSMTIYAHPLIKHGGQCFTFKH